MNDPRQVPLIERLSAVPQDAVLKVNTPNALGVDTHSLPVGRLCHEAASSLSTIKEMREALEGFMALDRSFSTICDEHLSEMVRSGSPMAMAVQRARSVLSKYPQEQA